MSNFVSGIKIVYFRVCAKAEHAKYMLAFKGISFEEIHPKDYFGKVTPLLILLHVCIILIMC